MVLAGYREDYWPNDKNILLNKRLIKHVDEIVNRLKSAEVTKEFINVRNNALPLVREVKEHIIRILHAQKLPGKCDLY